MHFLFLGAGMGESAVELDWFFDKVENSGILLKWEKSAELDLVGFSIASRIEEIGDYFKNPLIKPEGAGGKYEYNDDKVFVGTIYFYQPGVFGLDHFIEYSSSITTTITNTPTDTSTLTQTPTQSRTPSNTTTPIPTVTGPTSTASKTSTRTPSKTPSITPIPTQSPFPKALTPTNTRTPTLTLSPSPTITFTATITPTSTFESVPTIVYTLKFQDTSTPISTPSPTIMTIPSITPSGLDQYLNNLVESGQVVQTVWIIIVVAFWGIIAIGTYIYLNNR
jgi:hypothetical protein